MAKRASLASLAPKLAKKPAAAPVRPTPEPAPEKAKAQPDGRRGILVRARPEAWKALKLIAIEQETTLQAVMVAAINDYLQKNGQPPLA